MCKSNNALSIKRPDLAEEWHPTKNGDLTPNDVSHGSNKKVWWQCKKCNHESELSPNYRNQTKTPFCISCNSLKRLFPQIAEEWHPTKNGDLTPNDFSHGSHKKIWWQCSNNPEHEWEAQIRNRTSNNRTGCTICSGNKVTEENCLGKIHPEIVKEWHPTKNKNIKHTPYTLKPGSGQKVWWQCSVNPEHEWKAEIKSRTKKNGSGCPKCLRRKNPQKKSLGKVYPEIAKEWHSTKNKTIKHTPYTLTFGSRQKVWWQCSVNPKHEWKAEIKNRTKKNSTGCPYCKSGTSFPEQALFYYLEKIFIEAKNGEKIKGSRKEMDISIQSLKLAIEYDGKHYHQDVEKDKEKDQILQEQGWLLIRIREKGCPTLKNSTSILYHRKNNKEETLPDALQFILQTIISRYPLNDIQLQNVNNLSVDLEKDRGAIKMLVAS